MLINILNAALSYQDNLVLDKNIKTSYIFPFLLTKNSILMLLPNNGKICGYPLVNNLFVGSYNYLFKNYDLHLKGAVQLKCNHNLNFFNNSLAINLDFLFNSKNNNNIDSSSENNFIDEENKSNIIFGNLNVSDSKVISSKTDDIIENTNIESTRDISIYINNDPSLNISSSSNDYSDNTESRNTAANHNNSESINNVNNIPESINNVNNNESTTTILSSLSLKNEEIKDNNDNIDNLSVDSKFKILGLEDIFINLDIVNDKIMDILNKKLENPINFIYIENNDDLDSYNNSHNNILIAGLKDLKKNNNLEYKFLLKYIYKFDFLVIINLFNGLSDPNVPFELKEERKIIFNTYIENLKEHFKYVRQDIESNKVNFKEFRDNMNLFTKENYIKVRIFNININKIIKSPQLRICIIKSYDSDLQLSLMIPLVENSFKKIYN